MSRCVSIYKVLGLWALIVILTGCAAEKEPLIISPLSNGVIIEPKIPEEVYPKFPGGPEKMFEFIADNLRWPEDDGPCIQGRVIISFIVEKDGSLSDIKVAKSIDPLFDEEAVRVVKSMPKWEPGMWRGKPTRVKYCIPISFRLAQNTH
jgi:TonB family protein